VGNSLNPNSTTARRRVRDIPPGQRHNATARWRSTRRWRCTASVRHSALSGCFQAADSLDANRATSDRLRSRHRRLILSKRFSSGMSTARQPFAGKRGVGSGVRSPCRRIAGARSARTIRQAPDVLANNSKFWMQPPGRRDCVFRCPFAGLSRIGRSPHSKELTLTVVQRRNTGPRKARCSDPSRPI
jgi:hypothetical protein